MPEIRTLIATLAAQRSIELDAQLDFVIPVDLLNDPEAAAGQGGRKMLPTDLSAQSLIGRTFGPNLTFEVENAARQTFEVRFKVVSAYQDR